MSLVPGSSEPATGCSGPGYQCDQTMLRAEAYDRVGGYLAETLVSRPRRPVHPCTENLWTRS